MVVKYSSDDIDELKGSPRPVCIQFRCERFTRLHQQQRCAETYCLCMAVLLQRPVEQTEYSLCFCQRLSEMLGGKACCT